MKSLFLHLFFLCAISSPLFASDLAREQRMRAEIEDAILDGEVLTLKAGETPFMAIYTEAEPVKGVVIILHGMGAHPDWPDIINPLRTALPEAGWSTLSIQLPVGASDATFTDYLPLLEEASPRIAAATLFLKNEAVSPIIVLSHSLGGRMASLYLAHNPAPDISGFIAIGLSANGNDTQSDTIKQLTALEIPFLDIYGSDDLEAVRNTAEARKLATKNIVTQVVVEGANHFFRGKEDALIKIIETWLDTSFNIN